MSDNLLTLDHTHFAFEIVQGHIEKTNIWVDGETLDNQAPNKIKQKQKREFWLKTKDGEIYHFIVKARTVPIKTSQNVQVLAATKHNAYEAVLVYEEKEERIFTNMTIFGLVYSETPMLNNLLLLWIVIGIFFAANMFFGVLYVGVIALAATRWGIRLNYYKNKLEAIKDHYLIKDVE